MHHSSVKYVPIIVISIKSSASDYVSVSVSIYDISGQKGDYFYVIERGHFKVLVNGREVSILEEGRSFGELALLYNTPRAATIRAATPCVVFSLDRDTFRNTLANSSFSKVNKAHKGRDSF